MAINYKSEIKNILVLWLISDNEKNLEMLLKSEFILEGCNIQDTDFIMNINTEKAFNKLESYKFDTEQICKKLDKLKYILNTYNNEILDLNKNINAQYLLFTDSLSKIEKDNNSKDNDLAFDNLIPFLEKVMLEPYKELII